MPAEVVVKELNGSTGSQTEITELFFQPIDAPTPILPLPLPRNGDDVYSYWKTICLYANTPPTDSISNVKMYLGEDGGWAWSGVTIYVADQFPTTYTKARGVIGWSGDEMVANHPDVSSKTDLSTYTSSNPLSIPGPTVTTSGKIHDGYVILQLTVTSSALQQQPPSRGIYFRWDEV